MWEVNWWNLWPSCTARALLGVHKPRVKVLRLISCSSANWLTWFKRVASFDADGSSCVFDPCIYWMHHQWGTRYGQKKAFPLGCFTSWSAPLRCCAAGFLLLCQLRLRVKELPELWGQCENLADLPAENVAGRFNHTEMRVPGMQSIPAKWGIWLMNLSWNIGGNSLFKLCNFKHWGNSKSLKVTLYENCIGSTAVVWTLGDLCSKTRNQIWTQEPFLEARAWFAKQITASERQVSMGEDLGYSSSSLQQSGLTVQLPPWNTCSCRTTTT